MPSPADAMPCASGISPDNPRQPPQAGFQDRHPEEVSLLPPLVPRLPGKGL